METRRKRLRHKPPGSGTQLLCLTMEHPCRPTPHPRRKAAIAPNHLASATIQSLTRRTTVSLPVLATPPIPLQMEEGPLTWEAMDPFRLPHIPLHLLIIRLLLIDRLTVPMIPSSTPVALSTNISHPLLTRHLVPQPRKISLPEYNSNQPSVPKSSALLAITRTAGQLPTQILVSNRKVLWTP